VRRYRYRIALSQHEKTEEIGHARELEGCFVMLSNVP
jgi:hypothetical protein